MKRLLLGAVLSAAVLSAPAFAALKQGDAAPDFKAPASLAGKEFQFSLKNALKKGPVVVYFYPSAYTGGCNIQAHTFSENNDKFKAAGASIIGVSLDKIATLKPNAFFINVARGGSVVTADLMEALNSHRIAGAGLDVVDPEPLPPDHPLWKSPNLIISPHVSSRSDLPGEQRWSLAREQLRRYAAGEKMLSVVDLKREY